MKLETLYKIKSFLRYFKAVLIGVFIGVTLTACASKIRQYAEDNRILVIERDRAGILFFPYCKKGKFWNKDECKKKNFQVDVYDLANKETRIGLRDFRCVHKKRLGL